MCSLGPHRERAPLSAHQAAKRQGHRAGQQRTNDVEQDSVQDRLLVSGAVPSRQLRLARAHPAQEPNGLKNSSNTLVVKGHDGCECSSEVQRTGRCLGNFR